MFPFWTIPQQNLRRPLFIAPQNNIASGIGGNGNDIITINAGESSGIPGPVGPQGPQGPQGPTGNTGPAGNINFVNVTDVKLVTSNYTAEANDCYIGSNGNDNDSSTPIVITLPLGVIGKQYIIKNQKSENIKVQGSGGQTLDSSAFKTLGSEASLIAIFDGTRWNLV